jgi:hypothetical protein
MKGLDRPACVCSCLADMTVAVVSCASNGDTSSDTQPSTPAVRSDRSKQVRGPDKVFDRQLHE